MPVSFNPVTRSNNNNIRPLQEEENQAERLNRERYGPNNENNVNFGDVNPWPKGQFVADPEGALREAAESGEVNEENEEERLDWLPGRYPRTFRAEVARRATEAEGPVIVEGFEITEVVIGPDNKRYAKLCDKLTGLCVLVALAGVGISYALRLKGGKTRRRRRRANRKRKTRSH